MGIWPISELASFIKPHCRDSPYQNAKQEAFWGPVEGRLMAMLEDVPDLTLAKLNQATQAWVEDQVRPQDTEPGETFADLSGRHCGTIVAHGSAR